jgi:hypothetical protein
VWVPRGGRFAGVSTSRGRYGEEGDRHVGPIILFPVPAGAKSSSRLVLRMNIGRHVVKKGPILMDCLSAIQNKSTL